MIQMFNIVSKIQLSHCNDNIILLTMHLHCKCSISFLPLATWVSWYGGTTVTHHCLMGTYWTPVFISNSHLSQSTTKGCKPAIWYHGPRVQLPLLDSNLNCKGLGLDYIVLGPSGHLNLVVYSVHCHHSHIIIDSYMQLQAKLRCTYYHCYTTYMLP